MATNNLAVIVLDFDGVLAVPWSKPVQLYPQVPELLEKLASNPNMLVGLASFNPAAIRELRRHNVLHYFQACRAGSHDIVEFNEFVDDLGTLCKAEQIKSLQQHHFPHLDFDQFYFFDDDLKNLDAVQRHLPKVTTVHVDNTKGISMDMIDKYTC